MVPQGVLFDTESSGYAPRRLTTAQRGGDAPAQPIGVCGGELLALSAEFLLSADPVQHVLACSAVSAVDSVGDASKEVLVARLKVVFSCDQVVERHGLLDVPGDQLIECIEDSFFSACAQAVGDPQSVLIEESDGFGELNGLRHVRVMLTGAVGIACHVPPLGITVVQAAEHRCTGPDTCQNE